MALFETILDQIVAQAAVLSTVERESKPRSQAQLTAIASLIVEPVGIDELMKRVREGEAAAQKLAYFAVHHLRRVTEKFEPETQLQQFLTAGRELGVDEQLLAAFARKWRESVAK